MSQKDKTKFRASATWKKFRNYIKKSRGVDEITLKPLRAGCNIHHLDLREENYTRINDESRFMALNKQSHELIHFIFRYYQNDTEIIKRLDKALSLMKKYSED